MVLKVRERQRAGSIVQQCHVRIKRTEMYKCNSRMGVLQRTEWSPLGVGNRGGECGWERGSAGLMLSVLSLIQEGWITCQRKEGCREAASLVVKFELLPYLRAFSRGREG